MKCQEPLLNILRIYCPCFVSNVIWCFVYHSITFVADEKQHFLNYSSPDKNVFIVQHLFRDVNKINQDCLNMLYASLLGSFIHIVD